MSSLFDVYKFDPTPREVAAMNLLDAL